MPYEKVTSQFFFYIFPYMNIIITDKGQQSMDNTVDKKMCEMPEFPALELSD